MTELTRSRIEEIRTTAPRIDEGEIAALCDLALEALEMRPRPLAEAESINSEFSWEYAAQIAERFGVNESDRRKFGNEMAEVFRAMVKP